MFNLNNLVKCNPMRFVFFIVAAVVAIVVGVVVLRFNEPPAPSPQIVQPQPVKEVSVKTVNVLVARVDIPVGTTIDGSMVDTQPYPENLISSDFITSNDNGGGGVIGKITRSPIRARENFKKNMLANPNDPGFLSYGLPAGMRAVTVSIDAISGVAGYVFPGDRVYVMFVHSSFKDKQASRGQLSVAEVIAPNVRVLAVGERDTSPAPANGEGGNKPPANPQQPAAAAKNVTLEVSDALTQRIRLAEKNGSLSLSLRSIHDDNAVSPAPTTIGDLSRVDGGAGLLIVRGPGGSGNGKITANDGLSDIMPAGSPNNR